MTTPDLNASRSLGPAASPPCFPFLVGRGRSGTTLLLAMVDSHSDMAVPYESHFPVRMGLRRQRYEASGFDRERFLRDLVAFDGFPSWNLPLDAVRQEMTAVSPRSLPDAIRAVYAAYARAHGKNRYAEKSPGFVMSLPLLAAMFPEARFVHIIRDGRDVALSYLAASWGTNDLVEAAYYWRRFVRRGMQDGRGLGPDRYREIHYAQLVDDAETTIRSLCKFMDLPFEQGMLHYFDRSESVLGKIEGTPWLQGHGNVRRPPTRGLRDWRREMSRGDQLLFEAVAGDLLAELGYPREFERIPLSTRIAARRRLARVHARRAGRRVPRKGVPPIAVAAIRRRRRALSGPRP